MLKKMSALLLSASLLSAQFVAVCAENIDETSVSSNQEQSTEYVTDRFIVETAADTEISAFSTSKTTVSDEDIAMAINDVLSEVETVSDNANVSDVINIEENSSVVTLSENVNADEFIDSTAKYQKITGTLDKPAYVEVPSGKKATAIVYMKAATNAQLLSVTPKVETARFSLRSAFGLNRENELPDDVVEHKYIAEYLNEDGTITTEEFSTFEVIDVE